MHIRWSRAGVREWLFALLRDTGSGRAGDIFLNGSSGRAHRKAAGAKGGARRHALGRSSPASPPTAAHPAIILEMNTDSYRRRSAEARAARRHAAIPESEPQLTPGDD